MQLGIIVGLVFGILIAFFAFLNRAVVTVNYFFGQVDSSVALIVLGSAMTGALAIGLFGFITQIRTGFAMWNFKNKTKHLTKEVEDLKEQKRALADDLSFLNAECEQMRKEKHILESAQPVVPEVAETVVTEANPEETINVSE
ncbi:MAG: LapA family protein [Firmicutes bacterium]|nr:LapA family protein [Bacillota bacterium]